MKLLRSLPADKGFFDIYALLIKVIRKSKTASQVVSGLTEIGIIYSIAYKSIQPISSDYAIYIAGTIAIIFTIVIEGGLRVLIPLSVDAILFKRMAGLHLPMTIAIFLVTIVLLLASGILSFQNSGEIVAAVTPQAERQSTLSIDSSYQSETAAFAATYSADSAMIASRYERRIATEKEAFQAKIEATRRKLQSYINREARTGNSYASIKDRELEKIAELKAQKGEAIALLEMTKGDKLAQARTEFKAATKTALEKQKAASTAIELSNNKVEEEREAKVNSYGGKLGYFTLVSLFIFVAANILDRIHAKGSRITETIDISQYDVSPHWTTNALEAIWDRFNYFLQSEIKSFADATPPAPLPEKKTELYDPTQVANVVITLKIDQENGKGHNVIYIEPKRRKIGFQQSNDPRSNPGSVQAQQKKCAIKDTTREAYETKDLRQLKQRLKMYKKRLGSHEQKKIVAERKGERVSMKTINAIENNREWVTHYEQLINELTENK